ncbi:MAG: hypothetical protein R3A12_11180 [Ignavibacteria bacterium]
MSRQLIWHIRINSSIISARRQCWKNYRHRKEGSKYTVIICRLSINLNSRFQRAIRKQALNIGDQQFEVGSDNSFSNLIDVRESLPILGTPVFVKWDPDS